MIDHLIDAQAGALQNHYQHMLTAFEGAWSQFAAEAPTPMRARSLALAISGLRELHAKTLADSLGTALAEAKLLGYRAARAESDRRQDFEDLFFEEGLQMLDRAAAHDARTLLRTAQQVILRYQVATMRMPADAARLAALGDLPGQATRPFEQLSRANRRLVSTGYVANAGGDLLAKCFAHAFAAGLASRGESRAVAIHIQHPKVELDLLGNWPEWAAENMHRNTKWVLGPAA